MAAAAHSVSLALGLWLALASPAAARCARPPAPDPVPIVAENGAAEGDAGEFAAVQTRADRTGRVVAPVLVDGQGPFRFIVDTGANRSVLSRELAARLGLSPFVDGEVHTVHGVVSAPLVQIDALRFGDLVLSTAPAPLLAGAVLAGEHGLLGVDGMQGRTLRMDFERRCIEITSRRVGQRRGWTMIRGEMRFGHLVLVPGVIEGVPVRIMLDTGSNFSLSNVALRDALRARTLSRPRRADPMLAYTAGEPVVLDQAVVLPQMQMGDVEVTDVVAYVGDFHIFSLWGLNQEPALLIGMDVLSQTRALAIDYERATVHLRLHERVQTGSRIN